jgi:enoyl-[acyl-carrier protein] reductase II
MERIVRCKVPVVITSAGNPKTWTHHLKSEGIKVLHVVSSAKFAVKAEQAGVDGVIAEGFEAGGHNGREETTTFVLIPLVRASTGLPVIAAGGIATGRGMLAAMVLGADGVQMGTRFVLSRESSAHELFKKAVALAGEGDTLLTLKELTPVRLLKNPFFSSVMDAYHRGAGEDELRQLLGRGRAKKGMFEGDLEEGELEIGQISALLEDIPPAADIVRSVWEEFESAREKWCPEP